MRSRKLSPACAVTRTTIWSERTRVPPVTAERSPPDSRMTGADSPVIADSSTLAMPSITVPSAGITSPAETTTSSPTRSVELGTSSTPPSRSDVRDRLGARLAELVGLGLPASLGDRLGEVREEDGEPEPGGDEPREHARVGDRERRDEHAADLDHEHDRVARHPPWVELEHAVARRARDDRGVEERAGLVAEGHRLRCSRIGPSASTGR